MKVKLNKRTYWIGKALQPGDTIDVNSEVAERWLKNGIASASDEAEIAVNEDPQPAKEMTYKELKLLATARGIKYPKNVSKAVLINLLEGGGVPDKKKE